jgi:tetratricopeptide (TPR) repeat protein
METLEESIDLANRLIDNYKYEEAINYLQSAITHCPDSPDLYDLRGITWFRRLEIEKAVEDWKMAISIDNTFHLAYLHLAECSIEKNDFKQAELHIKNAIAIEPENLFYKVNLAFIKLHLKEYEECIKLCNSILNIDPRNMNAMEYRANSYMELKNYKLAAIDYETVCINSPDDLLLYNSTGYSYSKAGNIEKAKTYLSRAIQLDPTFAYGYNNLGYVYYLEKNFKKAHQLIEKSIELDPSNAYAYKNQALVFLAENDKENARRSLEKAKSLKFELFYGDEVEHLLKSINTD